MKKKLILNICMVLTVILVAVCGVMAVGSVKGWFGGNSEAASDMTVSEKSGIAMIERSGVAYEVGTGTALREADRLYTKTASALTIAKADTSRVYMSANGEISVEALKDELKLEVLKGEAMIDARGLENVTAISGSSEILLGNAVAAISTQAGSTIIYVYAGEVAVNNAEGESLTTAIAGKLLTITDGTEKYGISKLKAGSLSDAQITQLIKLGMDETFCFSEADLKEVQDEREAEIQKAQEEALKQKEEAKKKAEEQAKAEAEKNAAAVVETTVSESTDAESSTDSTETEDYAYEEDYDWGDDSDDDSDDGSSGSSGSATMSCTIKIVCDTILDNMDNLTSGKEGYVPSNGKILGTTTVEFSEGETVFDVLTRVCSSAGIQIEYSWTPMYDSYYIEGINHLYEFDCGSESGWMYKVNGWFPNYGCSSYYLEDGDTIVWCYTCNGLGADVGA